MVDGRRHPTPFIADERATLSAFLDVHRSTLLRKTAGLDAAALSATVAPSTMSLGGLLRHLALVEHAWFQVVFLGRDRGEPWVSLDPARDPEWAWRSVDADQPDELRRLLEAESSVGRAIVGAHDLDEVSAGLNWKGERCTLRWIVVHMIQEYARHNGHADLLRQSIDGSTGL